MIERLTPYLPVKPSGLPWLGDIPAHWDIYRIKALLREVDHRTKSGEERLFSLRMRQGLVDHLDAGGRSIPTEALIGYKLVEPGQVVMNRMRAASGLFGVARSRGLVSPDYAVFTPKAGVNPEYLLHLFRTPMLSTIFRAESKGLGTGEAGFLRLYTDRFGSVRVPYPPDEDLRAITQFLRDLQRRASLLLRNRQRLVRLLEERKSVLTQIILSGAGFNGPRVSSGSQILGDIPAHWERFRLCQVTRPKSECRGDLGLLSVFLDRGVIPYAEGGGQVHAPSLDLSNYQVVDVGDLVLNNQQAWRGSLGVSSLRGIVSPAYVVLQFTKEYDRKFANYLFRSPLVVGQLVIASKGVGDIQRQLSIPLLRNVIVPRPPLVEQVEISRLIEERTKTIQESIDAAKAEAQLVLEFRDRLCADVVCGKVDVRSAAMALDSQLADQTGHEGSQFDDANDPSDDDDAVRSDVEEFA